ncbi:hypothetical protein BB561_003265 [Smittium simulii]|uniref:Uncharacterized protein n=1 Tax=Smittium simulii TaxID=133385 RepID=A0A2T9YMA3_9FUNG|nr:hypothetical protein BB561_003265 [Smittium simulii]
MSKNSSNGAISQLTVLFLFTFWLLGTSVYIFSRGFLLSRFELPNLSSAKSLPVGNTIDHCLFFQTTEFQNGSEQTKLNATGNWIAPQFDRAIVLIVDALRIDFSAYNYSNSVTVSKNIAFNNKKFPGIESPLSSDLPNTDNAANSNYRNRMPNLANLIQNKKEFCKLYRFRADPPTTTLQRLKGLTTGQLPTFIDAGSNFAGSSINEDNWFFQFYNSVKSNKHSNIAFMGDDTWSNIFPSALSSKINPKTFRTTNIHHNINSSLSSSNDLNLKKSWVYSRPFPSLDVWDLDTVDDGILSRLPSFLLPNLSLVDPYLNASFQNKLNYLQKQWKDLVTFKTAFDHPDFSNNSVLADLNDWDLVIAHTLGVDHVGHRYGPDHREMSRKLDQMDKTISLIIESLDFDSSIITNSNQSNISIIDKKKTIFFVLGDHGMNSKGDHGGDSDEELDATLFVYSTEPIFLENSSSRVNQTLIYSFNILNDLNSKLGIYTDSDLRNPFSHNGHSTNSTPIRSVLQVDWVPTMSLLLGLPIPFNSLGSIVTDLFANGSLLTNTPTLSAIKYLKTLNTDYFNSGEPKNEKVLEIYLSHNKENNFIKSQEWSLLYSLRLNAAQLFEYLRSYDLHSNKSGFSAEMKMRWSKFYKIAQNSYFDLLEFRNTMNSDNSANKSENQATLENLEETVSANYIVFMRLVLADLKKVWAQFDNLLIVFGLLSTALSLAVIARLAYLIHYYDMKTISTVTFKSFMYGLICSYILSKAQSLMCLILSLVFPTLATSIKKFSAALSFDHSIWLANSFIVLGFFYTSFSIPPLTVRTETKIVPWFSLLLKKRWFSPISQKRITPIIAIALVLLHCLIFSSNSFTINEDKIVMYLLQTLIIWLCCIAICNFIYSNNYQNLSSLASLVACLIINRFIALSTVCREEENTLCRPTFYGSSQKSSITLSTVSLCLINIIFAIGFPGILYYQLYKSFSLPPTNLWTSVTFGLCMLISSFYWLIDSVQGTLDETISHNILSGAFKNGKPATKSFTYFITSWIGSINSSKLDFLKLHLPRLTFVLAFGIGLSLWLKIPFEVNFLKAKSNNFPKSKQTTTRDKKQRLKKDSSSSNKNQNDNDEYYINRPDFRGSDFNYTKTAQRYAFIALPYQNAYGASHIMYLTLLFAIFYAVSPPMGGIALGMMLIIIVLLIKSFNNIFDEENKVLSFWQKDFVIIVIITQISYLFYFATGHQFTIPSIQWSVAFIGLKSMSMILSGTLVFFNTMAAPMLATASIPLITFWLFNPETAKSSSRIHDQNEETINNNTNSQFESTGSSSNHSAVILSRITRNLLVAILIQGAITLFSMIFAAHFKRHLMVWKIFCPRFIFSVIVLVSITSCAYISAVASCVQLVTGSKLSKNIYGL